MYRIEASPAAERDLDKLKNRMKEADFERVNNAIVNLSNEPRPEGVRKIKGRERDYRIRSGDYRVVYTIDDKARLVVILQISRRSESTYRMRQG